MATTSAPTSEPVDLTNQVTEAEQQHLPPPPPPPLASMSSLAPGLAQRNQQQTNALVARPPVVRYTTLAEERDALNAALAGLNYRVTNDADQRNAKKAAGIGNTTQPAADFMAFKDRLIDALRLGALGGVDRDEARQKQFADDVKAALLAKIPQRASKLRDVELSFAQCQQFAAAVTEEEIWGLTATTLADKIKAKLGHGNLAGMFPGEQLEATPAQGGADRLGKMNQLGREIVSMLADAGADLKPELTGSIILVGGGYTGIPEDLDINVTTTGSVAERQVKWAKVQEVMNTFDGTDLETEDGLHVRVFAMTEGKVQGENPNIWERRYGYGVKLPGEQTFRVMPLEVEVKDVGGAVWREHLRDGAEPRDTKDDGASQPKWLMLDTMTRILGHRKNMRESLEAPNDDLLEGTPQAEREDRWRGMVHDEGLGKSDEKRLWEKLHVAAKMARDESQSTRVIERWVREVVKDADDYLELLRLAHDEDGYKAWLTR